MIGILVAVVVVVGVVAAGDLLLSFAVIRRLADLQSRGVHAGGSGGSSPAIGHRVGDFSVELLTGGVFTLADLAGTRAIVVFLMTSCEPCKAAVAELRALPAPLPSQLFILITGTATDGDVRAVAADMPAGALAGEISAPDATTRAFGVDGFPTALTIEDGVVHASGLGVGSLLDHVSQ
jgi:hypothetical protein